MTDLPIHADSKVLHDPGRRSFAEDFKEARTEHNRGVFSPPEPEVEEAGLEVDPDHILQTVSDNMRLRDQVAAQEAALEETRQAALDVAAYGGQAHTREDYTAIAEALLQSDGGGLRFRALVEEWGDVDPTGADNFLQHAEHRAQQAQAAASIQSANNAQREMERVYEERVEAFHQRHPSARSGAMQQMVAAQLASNPNALSSPESFSQALETAYAASADVAKAAVRSAGVAGLKADMQAEIGRRSFLNQVTPEHHASANERAARSAQTLDGLGDDIFRGTKSFKRSVAEQRNEELRDAFREHATKWKFS